MILQGEHITLREPMLSDAEQMMAWENDQEVQQVGTPGVTYTLDSIKSYIAGIKDVYLDKQLRMIVCVQDIGIGAIDLFDVRLDEASAQVGILIADKTARGRGYASEALRLMSDYAQEVLGIRSLVARVQSENEASLSFFQKNGYLVTSSDQGIIQLQLQR